VVGGALTFVVRGGISSVVASFVFWIFGSFLNLCASSCLTPRFSVYICGINVSASQVQGLVSMFVRRGWYVVRG
jgi:hypothetical protein